MAAPTALAVDPAVRIARIADNNEKGLLYGLGLF
jgi:hypothetical protein